MVTPPTLGSGIGGGQNGLGFRHRQWLDQWTVKAFERDGQHLAGQCQGLGCLLRDIAHKGAQGCQTNVAGASLATALLSESSERWPSVRCPRPVTPARPSDTSKYGGYCGGLDRRPETRFW